MSLDEKGSVVGGIGHKRALLTQQTEGGFPELKVLKQRLRNYIQPEMSLGHSDKPGTKVIQQ
jgi:predicted Rdx family selenoprotein